ncbi:MAG: class I SAM-dependent methyltransferase [Patescibacteria group bacterium]
MNVILLAAMIGIIALLVLCVVSLFWFGGLLLPIFYRGGPFVPTSTQTVKHMVALAKLTAEDHVADLGSGDGRLLFAAIQAGAKSAHGYEIHPILVMYSNLLARLKRIQDKAHTFKQSFWDADMTQYNVVLLYQLPKPMQALSQKLQRELPHGARIVVHAFPFDDWEPVLTEGKIYVYEKK